MAKGNNGRLGTHHSQKTIEKIRKANTGKRRSIETRERQKSAHLGKKLSEECKRNMRGKRGKQKSPRTEIHCQKLSDARKKEHKSGKLFGFAKAWRNNPNFLRGENNPRWIKDRTKIKKQEERNSPNDKQWKYAVYKRDNFKCRINNQDCKGRMEAHHILSWTVFPELRFVLNNGITLCHAHHPRKRAEEKQLISVFTNMVVIQKQ